ncbi:MAG: acetylxylan esterase [Bryobacteraceae bacterium]
MLRRILASAFAASTLAAGPAELTIPVATGPLVIDGRAGEAIWQQGPALPLEQPPFGDPFPGGGEVRVLVRSGYLCFSARLPEAGRVVARSTGANPAWWREDLIVWTVRFRGFARALKVAVNPLGACSVEYTGAEERGRGPVPAAAALAAGGWSAEAAIPLENIAPIGYISAERIRAPRPDAPELRWHWPGVNRELTFELPAGTADRQPPPVQNTEWWRAAPKPAARPGEDPVAAQIAALPHRIWSGGETKPRQMWEADLRARVRRAAAAERQEWERVRTLEDWERFRARRVDALKASLGAFPPRTPLRAAVTRRLDYGDGFAIENVLFESRPGLVATANLYLPAKISGRIPAIVIVHSHHAPKIHPELQDLGMTWARSGTAVLVMDQLGAGERLQSQPWPRESYYSRYALGMQLYLAGESLMKWMAWDLMRGIDLLLERPWIDPKRIVMLGAVAGGGDPAAVTAVLDERIAAVLPFNFGEAGPEEHYTEGPRPYDFETADPGWGSWESTRCLRHSIAGQFFPWLICSAVAPRPFVFSFEIGWPDGVEKEPAWARYRKVYRLYGRLDRLEQVDGFGPFPGPGEVTNVGAALRRKIDPILERWLTISMPASEYHNVRPDADLMCLTAAAAAERRPKAACEIAAGMAEERLAAARARRSSARPGALRAALEQKLGDIEPEPGAAPRVLWRKPFSGFAAEAVMLQTAAGIQVPLLIIKPDAAAGPAAPVILALAQGGKEAFLSARAGEIAGLLKRGVAVALADVRGAGETQDPGTRGSASLAATELMLGNTALGARLKDARTVVRYLGGRGDLDSGRLAVWGDSFADLNPAGPMLDQSDNQRQGPQVIRRADPLGAVLALLTALYEPGVRAVAARGGLVSFLSVLRDRFCYVPLDVIVPGVLEAGDMADIVAALAPRGVLLERLVDGRNRAVGSAERSVELRVALDGYRNAPSQLTVREDAAGPELTAWLAARLSK